VYSASRQDTATAADYKPLVPAVTRQPHAPYWIASRLLRKPRGRCEIGHRRAAAVDLSDSRVSRVVTGSSRTICRQKPCLSSYTGRLWDYCVTDGQSTITDASSRERVMHARRLTSDGDLQANRYVYNGGNWTRVYKRKISISFSTIKRTE